MRKFYKLNSVFKLIFQLEEISPCVSIVNPKPPVMLLPGTNEALRNPGGKTISSSSLLSLDKIKVILEASSLS